MAPGLEALEGTRMTTPRKRTPAQERALKIIAGYGCGVAIVDGEPRCGWRRGSFSLATVEALVARGDLVPAPNGVGFLPSA